MARVHRSIGVGCGHCRRFGFFFVLAAALAALLPWRLLGAWLRPERPSWLGVVFQRLLLRGLRIRVATWRAIDPGALVVANHISWTDILVLGSLRPMAFVAKSEVRGWPLLGILARLHGTLFIRRGDRGGVAGQVDRITAALERGPVVLFPEGTTGNGADVLPFRSTLFAAAAGRWVQPVTLRYRPRGR
jgi:1-acyl-sn-glycerol-3-phosphate acyltransferase